MAAMTAERDKTEKNGENEDKKRSFGEMVSAGVPIREAMVRSGLAEGLAPGSLKTTGQRLLNADPIVEEVRREVGSEVVREVKGSLLMMCRAVTARMKAADLQVLTETDEIIDEAMKQSEDDVGAALRHLAEAVAMTKKPAVTVRDYAEHMKVAQELLEGNRNFIEVRIMTLDGGGRVSGILPSPKPEDWRHHPDTGKPVHLPSYEAGGKDTASLLGRDGENQNCVCPTSPGNTCYFAREHKPDNLEDAAAKYAGGDPDRASGSEVGGDGEV